MATATHEPWHPQGIRPLHYVAGDMDTVAHYMGHNPRSIQELMQLIPSFKQPTIPADVIAVKAILKMINQE